MTLAVDGDGLVNVVLKEIETEDTASQKFTPINDNSKILFWK